MTRTIKTAEVKNHNSARSVWIIIHNEVYDVTKFLSEHPGGEESLLDFAGKDGTQAFEDVGHSDDARVLMKKYKIGKLPNTEHTKPVHTCGHGTQTRNIDCIVCQAASSCPGLPKSDPTGKTWRTFDGTSDRSKSPKADVKKPATPRAERRVQSIVVPRERRPRGPPCPGRPSEPPCGSSKWKWAILILGAAIIVGLVAKKYAS